MATSDSVEMRAKVNEALRANTREQAQALGISQSQLSGLSRARRRELFEQKFRQGTFVAPEKEAPKFFGEDVSLGERFTAEEVARGVAREQLKPTQIQVEPEAASEPSGPRFFDIKTQTLFPDEPGRARRVTKPIFTEATGRRISGEQVTLSRVREPRVFREPETGLTIGVEDPTRGFSFATTKSEEQLQREAVELALARQPKPEDGFQPELFPSFTQPFVPAVTAAKDFVTSTFKLTQERTPERFVELKQARTSLSEESSLLSQNLLKASVGTAAIGTAVAFPQASLSIGKTVGFGLGTQQIVLGIGREAQSKELKEISQDPAFKQAFREARQKTETELIEREGKLKGGIRLFIPTEFEFSQRERFRENLITTLRGRGFEDYQLELGVTAGERKFAFDASGELAALLAAGAATESIGRQQFSKSAFQQTAKGPRIATASQRKATKELSEEIFLKSLSSGDDITKLVSQRAKELTPLGSSRISGLRTKAEAFKIIAPLGVGEGITESVASDIAEGRQISLGKAAAGGAFGGITAGLVGASIVTSKGFGRAGKQTVANILDPTELPGDILSSIGEEGSRKATGRLVTAFSVNPLFATSPVLTAGIAVPTQTNLFEGRIKTPSTTQFQSTPLVSQDVSVPSLFETQAIATPLPEVGLLSLATDFPEPSPLVPNQVESQTPSTVLTEVPTIVDTSVPADVITSVATSVPTTVPSFVPTTVPSFVPATVPVAVPVITGDLDIKLNRGKRKAKYNTQVKVKGKWKSVNKKPLTKDSAFDFGNYVVDNSAARSFRITKSRKKGKAKSEDYPGNFNPLNYNKKGKTYIEKAAFAINTPGELRGVTALGLLSQRKKRRENNMLKGLF